jgi:hypothetical protein
VLPLIVLPLILIVVLATLIAPPVPVCDVGPPVALFEPNVLPLICTLAPPIDTPPPIDAELLLIGQFSITSWPYRWRIAPPSETGAVFPVKVEPRIVSELGLAGVA